MAQLGGKTRMPMRLKGETEPGADDDRDGEPEAMDED